jgi:NAD(P)-dependent dehydrogenase (short-subunit alcohol dehydrogenase family)
MKLKDRVAIVTGGARGIGKAIVLTLIREGAKVAIVDVDKGGLETLQNEIEKNKGDIINISCDITKSSEVKEMVSQVKRSFGRIDILVNNAGIIRRGTIETVTEEDWDRVIEVNLKGTFNCCKAVVEIMKQQGYGKIVNVSSSAGRSVSENCGAHYAASKAGILGLTRQTAFELAPYNINVNAICPGIVMTDLQVYRFEMEAKFLNQTFAEREKSWANDIPQARIGSPGDVADLAAYLASKESSYITGQAINVDGGLLMAI